MCSSWVAADWSCCVLTRGWVGGWVHVRVEGGRRAPRCICVKPVVIKSQGGHETPRCVCVEHHVCIGLCVMLMWALSEAKRPVRALSTQGYYMPGANRGKQPANCVAHQTKRTVTELAAQHTSSKKSHPKPTHSGRASSHAASRPHTCQKARCRHARGCKVTEQFHSSAPPPQALQHAHR